MTAEPHDTNWRYFAAVLTALSVVWWAVVSSMDRLTTIHIPEAAGIGVYFAAVFLAGTRYAASRNWSWDRADRHQLAIAYAAVSVGVAVLLVLLNVALIAFEQSLAKVVGDLAKPAVWGIPVAIVALTFPLNYVFNRFFLGTVKRPERAGIPS